MTALILGKQLDSLHKVGQPAPCTSPSTGRVLKEHRVTTGILLLTAGLYDSGSVTESRLSVIHSRGRSPHLRCLDLALRLVPLVPQRVQLPLQRGDPGGHLVLVARGRLLRGALLEVRQRLRHSVPLLRQLGGHVGDSLAGQEGQRRMEYWGIGTDGQTRLIKRQKDVTEAGSLKKALSGFGDYVYKAGSIMCTSHNFSCRDEGQPP